MTRRDLILLAALELAEDASVFEESAITVTAWRGDNQTFGLRGFGGLYPDHKRAYCVIRGLRVKGLLEVVGEHSCTLTEAGRKAAEKLKGKTRA